MINVASSRAAVAAIPGDVVMLPKAQMDVLLSEVERGQRARLALAGISAPAGNGAAEAGAPA